MSALERSEIHVPLSNELWEVFDRATEIAKEKKIFPVNVDCALLALLEVEEIQLAFIDADVDPAVVTRTLKTWMVPNCVAYEEHSSSFNFEPVIGSKSMERAYDTKQVFQMGITEITLPLWFLALVTTIKETDPETFDMLSEVVDVERLEQAAIRLLIQSVEDY